MGLQKLVGNDSIFYPLVDLGGDVGIGNTGAINPDKKGTNDTIKKN